ncbi:Flp pilus assembly pilin Flp [Paraburkholderia sp. GAS334]|jgi:pilus assembly protein Flp/PilA
MPGVLIPHLPLMDADRRAVDFSLTGVSMKSTIQQFLRDEEGVAAIEYALLAGLIAVGIIVAATAVGTDISGIFTRIGTKLNGIAVN